MSPIQTILREIDRLDDQERLALERQLAQRAEAEWDNAVSDARKQAHDRGIDQTAIDQAIERRRYGR